MFNLVEDLFNKGLQVVEDGFNAKCNAVQSLGDTVLTGKNHLTGKDARSLLLGEINPVDGDEDADSGS